MGLFELDNFGRRTEVRPRPKDVPFAQPDECLLRPAKSRRVHDDLLKDWLEPQSRLRHRNQYACHSLLPRSKVVELSRKLGPVHLLGGSARHTSRVSLRDADKDVGIGGAGLAAAAVELGLIDELRLFRNPVVVGGGTPFLPPVTDDIALELIEIRTFGSRVVYERYRRARDDSD